MYPLHAASSTPIQDPAIDTGGRPRPDFERAVQETLTAVQSLEDLFEGDRRWHECRDAIDELTTRYTGDTPDQTRAQDRFFAEGLPMLLKLLDLLQRSSAPAVQDRVLRSLHQDFRPNSALPDAVVLLGNALRAARDPSRQIADQDGRPLAEKAAKQTRFYKVALSPAQFRASGDFLACRAELFQLFIWLAKELEVAAGPERDVSARILAQASKWTDLAPRLSDAQAAMYGAGKRLMWLLCQLLKDMSCDETRRLAARALSVAFHDGVPRDNAVTAIGRAVSAVVEHRSPEQAERRRALAASTLSHWTHASVRSEWSQDVVTAGLLEHLGFEEASDVVPDTAFVPTELGAQAINAAYQAVTFAADHGNGVVDARRVRPPPTYAKAVGV